MVGERRAPSRRVLFFGLGLLWAAGIGMAGLIVSGWRPESPRRMPPFGATAQQCEAVFGHPFSTGSDMEWLHRTSHAYYAKGWYVIASFDEQGRAEQFIFSKAKLPIVPSPQMSIGEQQTLLDKFKEGSTWTAHAGMSIGPMWSRADNNAYAYYMTDWRWMLMMNEAGMKRSADALQRQK